LEPPAIITQALTTTYPCFLSHPLQPYKPTYPLGYGLRTGEEACSFLFMYYPHHVPNASTAGHSRHGSGAGADAQFSTWVGLGGTGAGGGAGQEDQEFDRSTPWMGPAWGGGGGGGGRSRNPNKVDGKQLYQAFKAREKRAAVNAVVARAAVTGGGLTAPSSAEVKSEGAAAARAKPDATNEWYQRAWRADTAAWGVPDGREPYKRWVVAGYKKLQKTLRGELDELSGGCLRAVAQECGVAGALNGTSMTACVSCAVQKRGALVAAADCAAASYEIEFWLDVCSKAVLSADAASKNLAASKQPRLSLGTPYHRWAHATTAAPTPQPSNPAMPAPTMPAPVTPAPTTPAPTTPAAAHTAAAGHAAAAAPPAPVSSEPVSNRATTAAPASSALAPVLAPAAMVSPETATGRPRGSAAAAGAAAGASGRWAESYTVSYQQGAVGMSFGQLQDGTYVVARSTSQSEALGVRAGDRIDAVSGTPVRSGMGENEVLELIQAAPRPFPIQLQRQRGAASVAAAGGRSPSAAAMGQAPPGPAAITASHDLNNPNFVTPLAPAVQEWVARARALAAEGESEALLVKAANPMVQSDTGAGCRHGRSAKLNDTLVLSLTGWLDCSSTEACASLPQCRQTGCIRTAFEEHGAQAPMAVRLGAGQLVAGLDLSLRGMCAGEAVELKVPSMLAYGARGRPHPPPEEEIAHVPKNMPLFYKVTLLRLQQPGQPPAASAGVFINPAAVAASAGAAASAAIISGASAAAAAASGAAAAAAFVGGSGARGATAAGAAAAASIAAGGSSADAAAAGDAAAASSPSGASAAASSAAASGPASGAMPSGVITAADVAAGKTASGLARASGASAAAAAAAWAAALAAAKAGFGAIAAAAAGDAASAAITAGASGVTRAAGAVPIKLPIQSSVTPAGLHREAAAETPEAAVYHDNDVSFGEGPLGFGFLFDASSSHFFVDVVAPEEQAARAGVRVGDRVVAVGGDSTHFLVGAAGGEVRAPLFPHFMLTRGRRSHRHADSCAPLAPHPPPPPCRCRLRMP
jgi:hypothetical protein